MRDDIPILRLVTRDPFNVRLGCCIQNRMIRVCKLLGEDLWLWKCPECGTYWDGDEHSATDRTIVERAA